MDLQLLLTTKSNKACFRNEKYVCVHEGISKSIGVDDSYSPEAIEVSLMTAIAAEHGGKIYKTDTKQAFLYGDLEEDEQ